MKVLLVFLILLSLRPSEQGIWNTCRTCGLRPVTYFTYDTARIVGGQDAKPGAWPWIVSVQRILKKKAMHVCGGTLITSQWVLSAAHCFVMSRNVRLWRIVAGTNHLPREGPEAQVRYVKQIIIHEGYSSVTQKNDIALIELNQPIQCSPYVQRACLPDASLRIQKLTNCHISGWGATTARSAGRGSVLQEAQVHLINAQVCNSSTWYRGAIHPDNLCAGYPQGGIDTCQGDSGGPLVCQDIHSDQFWLVGVTSRGTGCARARRPGVYVSTQHFSAWILAQLGRHSAGAGAGAGAATPTQGAPTHLLSTLNPSKTTSPRPSQLRRFKPCLYPKQKLADFFSQVQELLQDLRAGDT